jgi:hypothetical protein
MHAMHDDLPLSSARYLDYCMTCPLIALDLLWNINAPYKATLTFLVLICLVTAVASSATPAPASYAWFGMGMLLFAGTYFTILNIVRERLDLYVVMAKDIQTKKSIKYLRCVQHEHDQPCPQKLTCPSLQHGLLYLLRHLARVSRAVGSRQRRYRDCVAELGPHVDRHSGVAFPVFACAEGVGGRGGGEDRRRVI